MRWLWVTTKPPWPPVDGGRLLVERTVSALAARGHRLTVIAAVTERDDRRTGEDAARGAGCELRVVTSPARSWLGGGLAALAARRSVTFTRHAHPALGARWARRSRATRPRSWWSSSRSSSRR
ncbi:MAG: hypothetical protein IPK07_20605 [Deltaproteobacteria bacterium]|nr:hypothetical protein [Deltaproteobacteria bacterium]